jgi:chromate reductase, NAD(P)H dehydrogenase (quinone)
MKNIFVIMGSASDNSSNSKLMRHVMKSTKCLFNVTIFDQLKELPHFSPEQSVVNTPQKIADFRKDILQADGVIICTPEYIFSIPSGLKNALEWCVSTTIFSKKPIGLITASANGASAHEELKLIMKTLDSHFSEETTLLIQGIKGKIQEDGTVGDLPTRQEIAQFIDAYTRLVENPAQ